ncbi:hypothetical protein HLRTI_003106 [Halorhabdus tiamatea SARL4B]|uniref:Uncharacterized protein n=1 Tax=Halorhabdus tiamatea SARL4B TaxID=1033806 RepID=F7PHJ6_9EURY|nr:hypothetical protein [Halorhabdus tiamatea]ERJ04931.1 hypothetical protein HLRTI_003106 [Halorhabdus tiamatea SARL4B]CCQ34987.1 hypothetical protein HTIA_p2885 [Halorhabdus tiamatea SARL4B]
MPPTDDLHPQDWLIIVQALDELAEELTYCGRKPPRAERARNLADHFAAQNGIHRDAIQTQLDPTWHGPADGRER